MADLAHAALAALPVLAVFGLIATRRVAAWRAALAGAAVAILLATIAFGLPAAGALSAAAYGIATGLFPILYIIAGSLLLYHLTVVTGRAERLREALAHLAADRYLLLLVVGFCFAGFLDATAGFLTPVTVCTALLVNLGVPAVEAAAYTLVASSLPPIFGAMGIPVLVLAESAAVPLPALARAQAAVAAALSVAFPAWLTLSFGGRAALRRVWAPSLAAGAAYAVALWWMVSRVSLTPAALAASLAALAATAAAASLAARSSAPVAGRWRGARAWWPWGVLMGTVLVWSLPPVARALARFTLVLPMPALHPAPSWRIDLAASPGTAILAAVAILLGRGACVGRAARRGGARDRPAAAPAGGEHARHVRARAGDERERHDSRDRAHRSPRWRSVPARVAVRVGARDGDRREQHRLERAPRPLPGGDRRGARSGSSFRRRARGRRRCARQDGGAPGDRRGSRRGWHRRGGGPSSCASASRTGFSGRPRSASPGSCSAR